MKRANGRKNHSAVHKAKVALEAAKGDRTVAELAQAFSAHPSQVAAWKKHLMEHVPELFERGAVSKAARTEEKLRDALYQRIGHLKVELDWLKKSREVSLDQRRKAVVRDEALSVRRQSQLLGVNRSGLYYRPAQDTPLNLRLMGMIDRTYTARPFYGYRRIAHTLRAEGQRVNNKRVQRLMGLMGLQALYPKPRTTVAAPGHKIYPYLLRHLRVQRPNQVWATDITYVPMQRGFLYLVAILDWYSRCVLAWELSNTMSVEFCVKALEKALSGGRPEIFNSDQGSQFTSINFTGRLLWAGIQVSMDGRGRALNNVFVERLWRTVKYEEIYLHEYVDGVVALDRLGKYFDFYNRVRPHQSLGYKAPNQVYEQCHDTLLI